MKNLKFLVNSKICQNRIFFIGSGNDNMDFNSKRHYKNGYRVLLSSKLFFVSSRAETEFMTTLRLDLIFINVFNYNFKTAHKAHEEFKISGQF